MDAVCFVLSCFVSFYFVFSRFVHDMISMYVLMDVFVRSLFLSVSALSTEHQTARSPLLQVLCLFCFSPPQVSVDRHRSMNPEICSMYECPPVHLPAHPSIHPTVAVRSTYSHILLQSSIMPFEAIGVAGENTLSIIYSIRGPGRLARKSWMVAL